MTGPPTIRGDDAAPMLGDLRLRRDAEKLHRLGPRATYEILAEIGREHDLRDVIRAKTARYAALPFDTLRALGADQMPPPPLHEITRT